MKTTCSVIAAVLVLGLVIPRVMAADEMELGTATHAINRVTLVYDPPTGELTVNTDNNGYAPLTVFVLESDSGIFLPQFCSWEMGIFDVCTNHKLAVIDPHGFGLWPDPFAFGAVLPTDLVCQELLIDVRASYAHSGGGIQPWPTPPVLLYCVPEPSSLMLLSLGLLSFAYLRRLELAF